MHWPRCINPTPYEIFGMTPENFDRKKLQEKFLEFAREYHPDRHRNVDKAKSELYAERFKQVVSAHSILKDDKTRHNWELSHRMAGGNSGRPDGRPQGTYTYHADRAQAWNDFSGPNEEPFFSKAQEMKFQESLRANRIFLLKCVTSVALILATVEFIALRSRARKQAEQLELESDRNYALYLASLSNYNMGNSAEDRIERFLQHRERFLKRAPDRSYAGLTQRSKEG